MATPEQEAFGRVARDPRRQWGWEPSPMASVEEQRAYEAYQMIPEIQAGRASVADLPEEYGGRPRITVSPSFDERGQPVGRFRRQLRMQEMYDAEQNQALEQQRVAQQMDLQQRAESRLQRAQDLELKKFGMAEEREARVVDEAGMIVDSIRGAVGPDGKVIAKPIRPEDDDAIERLEGLGRFKFGMENKSAQEMWSNLYNDALKFREDKINQSKQQELAAINLSVRTGKPFEEFGTYNEQGMFQPKLQGMITGAEEVKKSEEAKALESTIATERRRAETAADVAEDREKKTRRRQLDEDILTEEQILIDYQNQKESPSRDVEIKKSRAKLLNLGLKRAAIDDLVFKDQNDYKKALEDGRKIPSGTTIYIGTIPVKVK